MYSCRKRATTSSRLLASGSNVASTTVTLLQLPPFLFTRSTADFVRPSGWNEQLGVGKHAQIVEVELQREYEGRSLRSAPGTLRHAPGCPRADPCATHTQRLTLHRQRRLPQLHH